MLIVYSPQCLGYETPGHPESPERIRRMHEVLREKGFRFAAAEPATMEDVLLVHTRKHFENVRDRVYAGIETPPIDVKYPLLAAGVAIKASEKLGFALTRPPGHHAGRESQQGFCYFNNIAIAVKKLGKKTAILDIDTHHGNGTQDIFLGKRGVLYVSVHQSPLYPMTGLRSKANCMNFPLFPGTSEEDYLRTLEKALEEVRGFDPEVLAVSMGFDTYRGDPLSGQMVTLKGYEEMGRMVRDLGLPTFMTLEGGYSGDAGKLCYAFLRRF
jgi:acetoin utilization deacetylase AcuC-like enzyme